MKTKRSAKPKGQPPENARGERAAARVRGEDRRRSAGATSRSAGATKSARRSADAPDRPSPTRKAKGAQPAKGRAPSREPRGVGTPRGHAPSTTPVRRPAPAKNSSQAKARAKARKAKAPKVVRIPLRERLLTRLASVDLRPQVLLARVPFVVLVIGALGLGLGMTLWLSTDAAERSYQLGSAQRTNQALLQQKEALERDVLEAQAAPALAEAARGLGMIPSRDTAHLVQDPAGNWIVIGSPKPAEGAPPPPLNSPLPEDNPSPRPRPAAQNPAADPERPVRISGVPAPGAPAPGPEVPVRVPAPGTVVDPEHAPAGLPGEPVTGGVLTGPAPGPVTGPAPGPEPGPDPAVAVPLAGDPAILPAPPLPMAVDVPAPPADIPPAPLAVLPAPALPPIPGAPA